MKAAQPVNDPAGCVRADADRAAVRGDGEQVGGGAQRRHRHPTTVGREGHVLNFGRRVASVQRVQVVHGTLLLKKKKRNYIKFDQIGWNLSKVDFANET